MMLNALKLIFLIGLICSFVSCTKKTQVQIKEENINHSDDVSLEMANIRIDASHFVAPPFINRSLDFHALTADSNRENNHGSIGNTSGVSWSYYLVSAQSINNDRDWIPLQQTAPFVFENRLNGEGESQHFVRYWYKVNQEGIENYWNYNQTNPKPPFAGHGVLARLMIEEEGFYSIDGNIRWKQTTPELTDDFTYRIFAKRFNEALDQIYQVDLLNEESKQWNIHEIAKSDRNVGAYLKKGDSLLFFLGGTPRNYRKIVLDDRSLFVRKGLPEKVLEKTTDVSKWDNLVVAHQLSSLSLIDTNLEIKERFEQAIQSVFEQANEIKGKFGPSRWLFVPSNAEDLMQGIVSMKQYGVNENTTYEIGQPGNVDWNKVPEDGYTKVLRDVPAMFWNNALAEKYIETSDIKYFRQWLGYWSDWAKNWFPAHLELLRDPEAMASVPKDSIRWASSSPLYYAWYLGNFFGWFADVRKTLDFTKVTDQDYFDLATILVELDTHIIEKGVFRLDRGLGAPNQLLKLQANILFASAIMGKFKTSDKRIQISKDYLRRFISENTFEDGTSPEQSLNYNKDLPKKLDITLSVLKSFPKKDEAVIQKIDNTIQSRWFFLHSIIRPDGKWPAIGNSNPYRAEVLWPDKLEDYPLSQLLYEKVNKQGKGIPDFESIYFPMGGYAVLRDNWSTKGFHTFFKNSRPGRGHMREGGNGLQIYGNGRDLLVHAGAEQYSEKGNYKFYFFSTVSQNSISVDGYSQILKESESLFKDYERPINARWYTSKELDFIEGTFEGKYGNWNYKTDGSAVKYPNGQPPTVPVVDDVSHHRMVLYLKDYPLWVVLDRLSADQTHEYTQSWTFPPALKPEQIQANNNLIQTTHQDGYCFQIEQFANTPLQYKKYYGVHQENQILGWSSKDKSYLAYEFDPAVDIHSIFNFEKGGAVLSLISAGDQVLPKARKIGEKILVNPPQSDNLVEIETTPENLLLTVTNNKELLVKIEIPYSTSQPGTIYKINQENHAISIPTQNRLFE